MYIVAQGVPKQKVVVGKCGKGGNCCDPSDYVGGATLVKWVKNAGLKGVMYWSALGGCQPTADQWLSSS